MPQFARDVALLHISYMLPSLLLILREPQEALTEMTGVMSYA